MEGGGEERSALLLCRETGKEREGCLLSAPRLLRSVVAVIQDRTEINHCSYYSTATAPATFAAVVLVASWVRLCVLESPSFLQNENIHKCA